MSATHWHSCNVFYAGPQHRQLWQFERAGGGVALSGERQFGPAESLPARAVAKSWSHLWQRRLNVAWLPASQVFVRVVQLPAGEPQELPAMVEFQLERISPLPVAQVVWTLEPVPGPAGPEQTVVVILAARSAVEEFLGGLESAGYLADRLELPQLQALLATTVEGDGVWIYPHTEMDKVLCLAAWWTAGRLQNLNLITLPNDPAAGVQLAETLKQLAWAAEMEGWLSAAPHWRLVASDSLAKAWVPALQALGGTPAPAVANPLALPGNAAPTKVDVVAPLGPPELAALSANSATRANLVPAEFVARYRQQFIDRLWMRGLAALGMVYLLGVLGYFGALKWVHLQKLRVEKEVMELTGSYTNALQLKARVQVLQDQFNLKFAALDCWKTVSETLPEELTLTSLAFQRGRKLVLFGTVPSDLPGKVTDFNEALSKAAINGVPPFSQVTTRSIQAPPGQGRAATWSIDCDIKRSEVQ